LIPAAGPQSFELRDFLCYTDADGNGGMTMFHLWEKIEKNEVYFIAELSANHGGSLETALETVRAASAAGADCLKTQTYTADSLTIPCDREDFRIKGGLWDGETLYHLYQNAAMPYEWHQPIIDECRRCGIDFLSTPFDANGADFLESLGAEAYKIASFELVDLPLIEHVAKKGKPMVISTGMASPEEIRDAVETCRNAGNDRIVLLKCCSEYPAPWADMHLKNIPDLKERFGVPIGLSDHSEGSLAAIVAATLGACVIEKHIMLPGVESADSGFSMTVDDFGSMIRDVKNAALTLQGPDYTLTTGEKASTAFRRSLYAVKDIRAGETFTVENIRSIRPGYGLPPKHYHELLGKRSIRDIACGEPLKPEDLG